MKQHESDTIQEFHIDQNIADQEIRNLMESIVFQVCSSEAEFILGADVNNHVYISSHSFNNSISEVLLGQP